MAQSNMGRQAGRAAFRVVNRCAGNGSSGVTTALAPGTLREDKLYDIMVENTRYLLETRCGMDSIILVVSLSPRIPGTSDPRHLTFLRHA
jgi:hypothetical protein